MINAEGDLRRGWLCRLRRRWRGDSPLGADDIFFKARDVVATRQELGQGTRHSSGPAKISSPEGLLHLVLSPFHAVLKMCPRITVCGCHLEDASRVRNRA